MNGSYPKLGAQFNNICDHTNEHVLQPDVVGVCFKEISCEDKAGLGAHRAALHLQAT